MRMPKLRSLAATLLLCTPLLGLAQPADPAADAREQLAEAQAELRQLSQRIATLSREIAVGDIGEANSEGQRGMLGVLLRADAQGRVQISGVTPDGPAAAAGLRSGDLLLGVDGQRLRGSEPAERLQDARERLSGLRPGQQVRLDIERADGSRNGVEISAVARPRYLLARRLDADGAAFAALDGLESLEGLEALEALEGLESLEGLEALKGLEGLAGLEALASLDQLRDLASLGDLADLASLADFQHDFEHQYCEGGDCTRVRHLCSGDACDHASTVSRAPALALARAFRWRGLELATLSPELGRYFGADRGVLVLGSDPDLLPGLMAGDVLQSIGGTEVETPSDAMRALRESEPDAEVEITLLRDRRERRETVTTPEPMRALRFLAPPAPPAPPRPPAPPGARTAPAAPAAPDAPDAPPAPPAPPRPPGDPIL